MAELAARHLLDHGVSSPELRTGPGHGPLNYRAYFRPLPCRSSAGLRSWPTWTS
jgi:hypothetical protein